MVKAQLPPKFTTIVRKGASPNGKAGIFNPDTVDGLQWSTQVMSHYPRLLQDPADVLMEHASLRKAVTHLVLKGFSTPTVVGGEASSEVYVCKWFKYTQAQSELRDAKKKKATAEAKKKRAKAMAARKVRLQKGAADKVQAAAKKQASKDKKKKAEDAERVANARRNATREFQVNQEAMLVRQVAVERAKNAREDLELEAARAAPMDVGKKAQAQEEQRDAAASTVVQDMEEAVPTGRQGLAAMRAQLAREEREAEEEDIRAEMLELRAKLEIAKERKRASAARAANAIRSTSTDITQGLGGAGSSVLQGLDGAGSSVPGAGARPTSMGTKCEENPMGTNPCQGALNLSLIHI